MIKRLCFPVILSEVKNYVQKSGFTGECTFNCIVKTISGAQTGL